MQRRRRKTPKKEALPVVPRAKPITNALEEVLEAFKMKGCLARGIAQIAGDNGVRSTSLVHTDGSSVFAFGDIEIAKRIHASNGFTFLILRANPGNLQGPIEKMINDLSEHYSLNPRAFRLTFPLKSKSLPELSADACDRFKGYYEEHINAGIGQAAKVSMRQDYLEEKFGAKGDQEAAVRRYMQKHPTANNLENKDGRPKEDEVADRKVPSSGVREAVTGTPVQLKRFHRKVK